jgi:hypothetical protein
MAKVKSNEVGMVMMMMMMMMMRRRFLLSYHPLISLPIQKEKYGIPHLTFPSTSRFKFKFKERKGAYG